MSTFETDRLTIRPMSVDDMPDMYEIYSSERALKYVPHPAHQSLEETIKHFESRIDSQWSICLKGQDKVVGALNILHTRIPGLGYIIHPDYWGQGITVEACRGLLDYLFATLDHDRYEFWIDENNKGSLRVAEKLGFKIKGRVPHKYPKNNHYHHFMVWGMHKDEWLSGKEPVSSMTSFYSADPILYVHDIVATTDFYRDKLGFHVDFLYGEPPVHAGVSRGEWTANSASIEFSKISDEQEIMPSAHLRFLAGMGLDALFELYRDNGVSIVSEPADKLWGMREFAIKDINGYMLVFARYV